MLLASGAAFASLLLCDRIAIHQGPASTLPEDALPLSVISALPMALATADILKTRLVLADGVSRWVPAHRILAEYLGARWISACVDEGASPTRISALVRPSGAPPTSLRGLSAWLAHFSEVLAPDCIAADPFAVLRYGNAETLPLPQARALLDALSKLAQEDPYFRSEDWSRHPAAGLMRTELEPEVLSHLASAATPQSFVDLLLEAMVGTPMAHRLGGQLDALAFDPDRGFAVRSRAIDALAATRALEPLARYV